MLSCEILGIPVHLFGRMFLRYLPHFFSQALLFRIRKVIDVVESSNDLKGGVMSMHWSYWLSKGVWTRVRQIVSRFC
jgi:hypothetical protein